MAQLGGLVEVVLALGLLGLVARLLYLRAQGADLRDILLLILILGAQRALFFLEVSELFSERCQPFSAGVVLFVLERRLLDLQLHDTARNIVEFGRHGVDVRPDHGAGLVHQVDGLVGQEAVGNVAVGKNGRRHQRVVLNADAVVDLEALLEAAQDRNGVLHARRLHQHWLEAPFKRRVLFNVAAVLLYGCGAYAVQLAAGQHRLQHVACVQRALGLAGAHDGVQFVYEEDDLALALPDLVEHGLQPFLELAAELGASDQRTHVERKNRVVLEPFRHIAAVDADGQPFDYGRLADAWLADQHRVVLRLAAQDANHAADLLVAADDRVELVLARGFDKVAAVLLQHFVSVLRIVAGHALVAADLGQGPEKIILADAERGKDPAGGCRIAFLKQSKEEVLDGHVFVLQLGGLVFGLDQQLREALRDIDMARFLTGARNPRPLAQFHLESVLKILERHVHLFQQPGDEPLFLRKQGEGQMFSVHLLLTAADCRILRFIDRFL